MGFGINAIAYAWRRSLRFTLLSNGHLDPSGKSISYDGGIVKMTSIISLSELTPFISPPGDLIMAVLKGYFDDSDDNKTCSVSGYIASVSDWNNFEKEWKETLDKFEMPYLHMKEFAFFKNHFSIFKNNESRRIDFLSLLIETIGTNNLIGITSVIRYKGLSKFNDDFNKDIFGYSLNLYWCMMLMCHHFKNQNIEIILDKTNNLRHYIDKALNYVETDIYYPNCGDYISLHPLPKKGISFRELLPLQAADLLAWESRKDITSKVGWLAKVNKLNDLNPRFLYLRLYNKKDNKLPYSRKSMYELIKTIPTHGNAWDYEGLCILDNARHHIWPS